MTIEANEHRTRLREATNNARRYRQAVERISAQIWVLGQAPPTPRNKTEIRRLTRLANANNERATHWETIEKELQP